MCPPHRAQALHAVPIVGLVAAAFLVAVGAHTSLAQSSAPQSTASQPQKEKPAQVAPRAPSGVADSAKRRASGTPAPRAAATTPAATTPATGARAQAPVGSVTSGHPQQKGTDKPTADTPAEAAARREFATGEKWRSLSQRFDEWLAEQSLYDPAEAREMRARLDQRVKMLPVTELPHMASDLNAKLSVLQSPVAYEAHYYMTNMLSVAAPAYAQKLKQQLPDVIAMTPGEVQGRLSLLASKQRATAQVHETFERTRHMHVATHEAQKATQSELPRHGAARFAGDGGGAGGRFGGGTGPQTASRQRSANLDYNHQAPNRPTYTVVPVMPIWNGNGWVWGGGGVVIGIP